MNIPGGRPDRSLYYQDAAKALGDALMERGWRRYTRDCWEHPASGAMVMVSDTDFVVEFGPVVDDERCWVEVNYTLDPARAVQSAVFTALALAAALMAG